MINKLIKFLLDVGEIIIGVVITVVYVQKFTASNMQEFLATSGVVFASLATLCGLVMGLASIQEKPEDKVVSTYCAHQLLYATLCFLITSLFGVFALMAAEYPKYTEAMSVIKFILISFGAINLGVSIGLANRGIHPLSDYLWEKRNRWGTTSISEKESDNFLSDDLTNDNTK